MTVPEGYIKTYIGWYSSEWYAITDGKQLYSNPFFYNIIADEDNGTSTLELTYPNDSQPSDSEPSSYSETTYTIPASLTYENDTCDVTAIGDYAFYGCTNITSITLECTTPPTCGENTFGEVTTSSIELTVPEGYVRVYGAESPWSEFSISGGSLLYRSPLFYNIIIDEDTQTTTLQVTWGGEEAYVATPEYTGEITIPESESYLGETYTVTSIAEAAFARCTDLKSITIGGNITQIERGAFYVCTSLESVTLSNNLKVIKDGVFCACTSLTSIAIPASVVEIGYAALELCTSLAEITVAEGNQYFCAVDNVLFNNDKTTLLRYPAGSTATSYTVPNTVTEIGEDAFCATQHLADLTITENVSSIGGTAFEGITSEEFVLKVLNPTPPSLGTDVFDESSSTITIYFPAGTLAEYKRVWGEAEALASEPENFTGKLSYTELGYAVLQIKLSDDDVTGYATYYNEDYDIDLTDTGITAYWAKSISENDEEGEGGEDVAEEVVNLIELNSTVIFLSPSPPNPLSLTGRGGFFIVFQ